jgi:hypothetical protein
MILCKQSHHEEIGIPAHHLVIIVWNYLLFELPVELAQKAISLYLRAAFALSLQNVNLVH